MGTSLHLDVESCPYKVVAAEMGAPTEELRLFGLRPEAFDFPRSGDGKLQLFAERDLETLLLFPPS